MLYNFFTVIMSYLKSIKIILLLIALFIIAMHCTRQKSDLHISSVQKSKPKRAFSMLVCVPWNEIPQLLKNPMSKYTFKRKLKAHLLNE